ncbi:hypothetical protein [Pantoea ananatis]|uniref:hypothetical protein n=1 Tax=Pantoea ananas TaxID=553 RepID=UPI00301B1CB6
MRERPILLNAEMVRAVLDGRKTQTRRIMKVQPDSPGYGLRFITESFNNRETGKYFWSQSDGCGTNKPRSKPFSCPFGAVGDRLWVRESFYEHGCWQGGGYDPEDSYFVSDKQVLYPADGIKRPSERKREDFWRSRPSIHMPRWASRITLEVTGVRVERLNSISEVGAMREGIQNFTTCSHVDYGIPGVVNAQNPVRAFQLLWQGIYGEESWQANPWVWVIEFKRLDNADKEG